MNRSTSLWTALALTLLCGALIVRAGTTPAPVAATAPAGEFSTERAMAHEQAIAQRPHPSGSDDHARVRAYIIGQLTTLGLDPQLQEATAVGTRYPTAGHIVNVMARLPGRAAGGKAVLIAAHYDGVWASPAAGDDGAGSAALLETLRALRAGAPLEHDVIALFTDGEEAGLLGAAAVVREHPWAKDVEAIVNFEARGTEGRAFMFETGAGNLDVARVLRTLPDVTAGSLLVTVYRSLPNDTDLSEFSLLDKPALNFAFVDGVERYHTAHDDIAHLNPGSLQHHGVQMLALARAFGNGPLPRPATGDAIFFDAPFIGLVVYPESWGLPLALVVAALVVVVAVRTTRRDTHWGRGFALGAAGMLIATAVATFVAMRIGASLDTLHTSMGWDGDPSWRAVYAAALALLALSAAAGAWWLARRWAAAASLHVGALLVWTALALATAAKLPGASHLFAWPIIAIALAALADRDDGASRIALAARWLATIVACALLVPVIYTTAGYTLPLNGPGAAVVGALVPMLAWLLAPHLETLGGDRRCRAAGVFAAASLVVFAYGAATVRRSGDYPATTDLAYVTSLDADSAWLTAPLRTARAGGYATAVLGPSARRLASLKDTDSSTRWLLSAGSGSQGILARGTPRTITDGPDARVVADSTTGNTRRLTVHFSAPHGTLGYVVAGAAYMRAVAIDGRVLNAARYRRTPSALQMPFTAPPDSGFSMVIELPRDSAATLRLSAASAGIPAMANISVPARTDDVAPIQNGDVTVRYRQVRLP